METQSLMYEVMSDEWRTDAPETMHDIIILHLSTLHEEVPELG